MRMTIRTATANIPVTPSRLYLRRLGVQVGRDERFSGFHIVGGRRVQDLAPAVQPTCVCPEGGPPLD
jgi:hypothetical protein